MDLKTEVKLEEQFLKQAIDISKGAEVLPDGVEELIFIMLQAQEPLAEYVQGQLGHF